MKIFKKVLPIITITAIYLFSCGSVYAFAKKLTYAHIELTIEADSNLSYVVSVFDQRDRVVNGKYEPTFVGLTRSAVAIPYIQDAPNPFTDEVSTTICNGIAKSGAKVTCIETKHTESAEEILSRLKETKSERIILITITKWMTDTKPTFGYNYTELQFEVKIEIFDKKGNKLCEKRIEGFETGKETEAGTNLKSRNGAIKNVQPIIEGLYKEKIKLLFADENVSSSMKF